MIEPFMKNKQNSMTIDDLAAMIKRGFDKTATKDDLKRFATKDDLVGLRTETKGILKDMAEEMSAMHSDVRYIRSTVDKLVHSDIVHEAAIQGLTTRVVRLEQKTGLAK